MARIRIKPMTQPPSSVLPRTAIKARSPVVHIFLSNKGGSGTSFLASSCAGAFHLLTGLRVLLIDMDLYSGGIEAFTGVETGRSIFDLKPVLAELDEHHFRKVVQIEAVMEIDILLSPADPELAATIDETEIISVLTTAKSYYDLIVVDAGSNIAATSFSFLKHADCIHYVLTPDSPSLHRYSQTVSLLEKNAIPIHKFDVILNRTGKSNEIQAKDLKGMKWLRIAGTVRADFNGIQSYINLASPVVRRISEKKASSALKDIMRLTEDLVRLGENHAGASGQPL